MHDMGALPFHVPFWGGGPSPEKVRWKSPFASFSWICLEMKHFKGLLGWRIFFLLFYYKHKTFIETLNVS